MTDTSDPAERQEILESAAQMMSNAVPLEEPPATSRVPDAVSGSASGSPDLDAIRQRAQLADPLHLHIADLPDAIEDRAALLAEVDRLRGERDEARAAFAAIKEESATLQQQYSEPAEPRTNQCGSCRQHEAVDREEARARALAKTARRYKRERNEARDQVASARREERERCAAALTTLEETHQTADVPAEALGLLVLAQHTIRALPDTEPAEHRTTIHVPLTLDERGLAVDALERRIANPGPYEDGVNQSRRRLADRIRALSDTTADTTR